MIWDVIRKKLKPLFIFFLTVFSIQSFSQTVHWAKMGVGSSRDEGLAVCTDPSGNAFTIGGFASTTITFGSFTLTNVSNSATPCDVCVVKYDPSGNVLWAKSAGGSSNDFGYSVSADASGNVFATGYFTSPTITFGSFTLINPSANPAIGCVFIVKYDPNGNVLWAKSAGGTGFWQDSGYGVSTDASGNVFLTGYFVSPTITFGSFTLTSAGTDDFFIVKYDPSGNVLWAKSAGGANGDEGFSVSTDGTGNVYATGYFSGPTITFGSFTLTTAGGWDIFVVKYDPNGNVLWAKSPAGGTATDQGYSVSADGSGNVYATGAFASPTITFGSFTLTNAGNNDVYLVKYDPSGNVLWAKSAGGSNAEEGFSVSTDSCGHVYLAGGFSSNNSSISFPPITLLPPAGSIDPMFLVKFDANGTALCGSAYASGGDDANGISADRFGNVYFTGDFQANPFILGSSSLTLSGIENIFVAKYSCANTFSVSSTAATCTGNNGTASVTASGGCAPYTYVWSNGQTTSSITGLAAGTYTITITDACSNCYSPATVTIGTSASFTLTPAQTNATCSALGNATVTPSGGASPYTYSWNTSPAQTTQTATGLAAGNYSVIVTDASGCSGTATISVGSSPPIASLTISSTASACGINNGTANVSVNGGTSPFTYSWSNSQTTSAATGLAAGNYSVTVTDSAGCTQTGTVTITSSGGPTGTLSSQTNVTCNGGSNGSATVSASGGTSPYTFSWSNSQTTASATGLAAGNYSVVITDAGGCSFVQTVTITQPPAIQASAVSASDTCLAGNGTATATANNGSQPYTFLWSNNETTATSTGLTAGNYSVLVTDANGCTQTATVTVGNNASISANVSPNITITTGNSTTLIAGGGISYSWSTGANSSVISVSPLITTTYTVIVSTNGCSDIAVVTVFVVEPPSDCSEADNPDKFILPNAFSPNNDGNNERFHLIYGKLIEDCVNEIYIAIYNRWGENIFESSDINFSWDGTYKDKPENSAVFAWYMKAVLKDGTEIKKKGNISLLK